MGSTLTVDNIVGATTAANVKFPSGTPVQVVTAGHSTYVRTTATSFTDTGLTASITPKFSDSIMIITISTNVTQDGANANETACRLYMTAPSTAVIQEYQRPSFGYGNGLSESHQTSHCGFTMIHDHNTTSQITYKWQHKVTSGGGAIRHNDYSTGTPPTNQARIVITEIAQ